MHEFCAIEVIKLLLLLLLPKESREETILPQEAQPNLDKPGEGEIPIQIKEPEDLKSEPQESRGCQASGKCTTQESQRGESRSENTVSPRS